MQEYREIAQIMAAEQPEFDQLWGYNAAVRSNAFVADADEYGVARWETVVGVVPLPSQSLDERKATVLAKINEQLPYTVRALDAKLTTICGDGNYTIALVASTYQLDIYLTVASKDCVVMVQTLLDGMIPCNLMHNVTVVYNTHRDLKPLTHVQMAQYTQLGLREDVLDYGDE